MNKKYLITLIVAGKEQLFLKSNENNVIEWTKDQSEALSTKTIDEIEIELKKLFNSMESLGYEPNGIKIIELNL